MSALGIPLRLFGALMVFWLLLNASLFAGGLISRIAALSSLVFLAYFLRVQPLLPVGLPLHAGILGGNDSASPVFSWMELVQGEPCRWP